MSGHRLPGVGVKALLACGIAYPVTYVVANDVVAASRYPGYSRVNQAVSELSATGAPTRRFLVAMLPVFTAQTTAYGVGVWRAAGGRRALRGAGALLVAFGATGVAWVPFPMSSRHDLIGGKGTSGDVGHLVLSGLTLAEILGLLGVGARAFGARFRTYSWGSAAVMGVSMAQMSRQAATVSTGAPTPGMGVYERVGIGTWLQWMAVLAIILLRERRQRG